MPTYHPNRPPNCPPPEATPMDGVIYRSLQGQTPCQEDALSKRERQIELSEDIVPQESAECLFWGLSVWINIADVRHARRLFSFVRKHQIGKATISSECGVILHTPSRSQPEHRTFWRDINLDLPAVLSVVDLATER